MKNRMWEMSQDESGTTKEHVPTPYRASSKNPWYTSWADCLVTLLNACAGITLYVLMVGGLNYLLKHKIINMSKTPWAEYILFIGVGVIWYHMYEAIKKNKKQKV
jgi:hypothetical protein